MMIVAMNSEILTRFHRTCVVPLHFRFRIHKDGEVRCLATRHLLVAGCCCSRNHQVNSCEFTCSIKRSHEQQQRYSTWLRRRTHTTVSRHYNRWSGQVLYHKSSFGWYEWPEQGAKHLCGEFDSKSKVVGEDCRPRTTVGHL